MRIGRYEVLELLGEGAFGMVFAARDVELDREIALKVLMPQHTLQPQVMQRFFHEAKAAAKIDHPSIVTIYEFGKVSGTSTMFDDSAYIAMERVRGESLAARLRRGGNFPVAKVVELGRQIASAVGAAHRAGIIHRDLKPDNLMLARDPIAPGGERVKVLDFGIAKLGEAVKSETMKTVGGFGTPLYMSPEQFRAAGQVDARSDIYALGCILHELATGKPPFDGDDVIALFEQHSRAARIAVPDVPAHLSDLVLQMIATAPADRPADMATVEAGLTTERAPGHPSVMPTLHEQPSLPRAVAMTTLGGSASASLGAITTAAAPSRARRGWWAIGAGTVIAVGWIAMHGGGAGDAATPDQSPTPAVQPQPAFVAPRSDNTTTLPASAPPLQREQLPALAPQVGPVGPHTAATTKPAVHPRSKSLSPPRGTAAPVLAPRALPVAPPVVAAPVVTPPASPPRAKCGTNDPACAFGGS